MERLETDETTNQTKKNPMKNSNRVYSFAEIGESIKNSVVVVLKKKPKKNITFFKNKNIITEEFNPITIKKEFDEAKESTTMPEHINNAR
jgi:hypothetical protein